jgi:hypothetical protein
MRGSMLDAVWPVTPSAVPRRVRLRAAVRGAEAAAMTWATALRPCRAGLAGHAADGSRAPATPAGSAARSLSDASHVTGFPC